MSETSWEVENLTERKYSHTHVNFFAERGYNLPIECYDPILGQLPDSNSDIGQVWILFI